MCALALKLKKKIDKQNEKVTKKDWILVWYPLSVFHIQWEQNTKILSNVRKQMGN